MSEFEGRVKEALDKVAAPSDVKSAALAYVESHRAALEAKGEAVGSASSGGVPLQAGASSAAAGRSALQQGGLPQGGPAHCASSNSAPAHDDAPSSAKTSASSTPTARRRTWSRRGFLAAAACLAVAAVGFAGTRWYAQPTAYVGIDVNPSIELAVNSVGTVVGASSINEDGADLLRQVDLVGKSYEEAIDFLVSSDAFAPYVGDGSFIEVSVTARDEAQRSRLEAQSASCFDRLPCEVSCGTADEETRKAAHEAGMGVGRYRAALELMELNPDLTLEDCKGLSMRELRGGSANEVGEGASGHRHGRSG